MSESFSRVKLHWDKSVNLDVVKQIISARIVDAVESRQLEVELPYDQNWFEIVVRTPSRVEYSIIYTNSSGDISESDRFKREVDKSVRVNPATTLAADIIANDVPTTARLSGAIFDPGYRQNYSQNRPVPLNTRYVKPGTVQNR